MSTVRRLEHVGLGAARDRYEETVRFYETVFGWHRTREQPGELAFVGDGLGGRLEIFATDAPPLHDPHHLAFAVPEADFTRVADAIRQAGAALAEPFINDFGDRIVFFDDPAGNRAQIVARVAPLDE
ncbi:MAG TPA: VOC family protein [Thermomicrobiales bacterium]|nr:VOC family protein [Thermomicrobiales bacterium]